MREIKFRAWDIEMKRYIYPELWDSKMPTNWKQFFILEQFTGLPDKNGKEIYEGDICRFSYSDYHTDKGYSVPVIFSIDAYVFETDGGTYFLSEAITNDDEFEVVGNIHENPELVKA